MKLSWRVTWYALAHYLSLLCKILLSYSLSILVPLFSLFFSFMFSLCSQLLKTWITLSNLFYREGSARGFGIRINQSVEGSDSWVDDPITRHIISLCTKNEEEKKLVLWPLILHIKGHYCILVLPLVEPDHLKTYTRMCKRSDCGNAVGADESLSPLLLNLPSITG